YHNDLAGSLVNLALLKNDGKDYRAARQLLEQARPHHEAALQANPRHPEYRQFYRIHLNALVQALAGLGDHAPLAETADRIAGLGYNPADDAYEAARIMSRCVPVVEKDTRVPQVVRTLLAGAYAARSMTFLRQAVKHGYKDADHMKKDADLAPLHGRNDFQK